MPPVVLPLVDRFLQGACKVGVFTFVRLDRLLRTFKFDSNALEILALDKGTLGSVSVDTEAILLVFFASLVDMRLLRLLRLKLLLDGGLKRSTMLCLTADKGGDSVFKLISDLLRKLRVEARLLLRLFSQRIEGIAEFASKRGMSIECPKHRGPAQIDTHPISSLPNAVLASLLSRFA